MSTVAITGASSGLGRALAREMHRNGWLVYNLSLDPPEEDSKQSIFVQTDVGNNLSVREAVAFITSQDNPGVKTLVNCAAVNRISYLEETQPADWDLVMDTNAASIFYTAKAFLPMLKERMGTICNIVSDASHKPMTGSLAYNASKGAAHIMTLQLARELSRRHGICVFGVSPGKLVGTGMSRYIDRRVVEMRGWTTEQAEAYAQAGRLWPEEINVDVLAEFLSFLLTDRLRHRYFSGCIIPYGA